MNQPMTDAEILAVVQAHIDGKEIEECRLDGANRWIPFDGIWYFSCQVYRVKPMPQDEDEAAFNKANMTFPPLTHRGMFYAGLAHARQQKEDAIDKEMRESGFHPATPEEIQRYSKHHNPEFERKPEEIWVYIGDDGFRLLLQNPPVGDSPNFRLFREVI